MLGSYSHIICQTGDVRMELYKFGLGIFAFLGVILTFVLFAGSMNTSYVGLNLSVNNSTFSGIYNDLDEVYNLSQDMKDDVVYAEIDDLTPWESMTRGAYVAIRQMKLGIDIVSQIVFDVAARLSLPHFWITLGLGAFSLAITFGFIYLLLRFKP